MTCSYGSINSQGKYISDTLVLTNFNLTGTGFNANQGVITYCITANYSDANGLNSLYQELAEQVFQYLGNITGIEFQQTTDYYLSDIDFSDEAGGAYAYTSEFGGDGFTDWAVVNVDYYWNNGAGSDNFSVYSYQTFLHEILHALGLGHLGPYNGTGGYEQAVFANDSCQNSIMSYLAQTENPNIDASFAYIQTCMAADLVALNDMYGSQTFNGVNFGTGHAFEGNTVYGLNTNITFDQDPIQSFISGYSNSYAYTIVDTGGIDTLDFSGWSNNQNINLTVSQGASFFATASDVGGLIGNFMLAVGTIIKTPLVGLVMIRFWGMRRRIIR